MTSQPTDTRIHPSHSHRSASLLALASIFTLACIGAIEPLPTTATIVVIVSTAGSAVDPDGYGLSINGGEQQVIGTNSTISIGPLTKGSYVLELQGLAANCSVMGRNPLPIDLRNLRSASPVTVSFYVRCNADDDSGAGWWDY